MQPILISSPERPLYYMSAQEPAQRLFILGNAYGLMPYQDWMAQALAARGYESIWFPFSGQPGTEHGCFSIRSGVEDLTHAMERADTYLGPAAGSTSILAHCASVLIAVEYLRQRPETMVSKLIAYSPLIQPRRIQARAETGLAEAGVRSGLTDWDWDYSIQSAAPALADLPVLLCQVRDALNRPRATLDELCELARALPSASVSRHQRGYDHRPDVIDAFATEYDVWLRR